MGSRRKVEPKPLLWHGKIWCSKRKDRYYKLLVFRDRDAMYSYWNTRKAGIGFRGRAPNEKDFEAQACWLKRMTFRRHRWHRSKFCGEIMFHAGRLGVGIVSHEMLHAAYFYLAYDRGLDPHPDNHESHEKLCLIQGSMVVQFWLQYWRLA